MTDLANYLPDYTLTDQVGSSGLLCERPKLHNMLSTGIPQSSLLKALRRLPTPEGCPEVYCILM